MNNNRIIIALDSNDLNYNLELIDKLKNESFAFKIGYEFFFNFGFTGYKLIKKKISKYF